MLDGREETPMRVRYYPPKKSEKSSSVVRFMKRHHVNFEQVGPEEARASNIHPYRLGEVPMVEVDGRVFVNPNDDALKKIFRVA